jgi:hypothetical protein
MSKMCIERLSKENIELGGELILTAGRREPLGFLLPGDAKVENWNGGNGDSDGRDDFHQTGKNGKAHQKDGDHEKSYRVHQTHLGTNRK